MLSVECWIGRCYACDWELKPTAMLNVECWILSCSLLTHAMTNYPVVSCFAPLQFNTQHLTQCLRQCWVLNVEFWVGRCYACDWELKPTAMLNVECWILQCWVLSVECWIGRCYACDDELFNCELMHLTLVLNSWIICGNSWLKVLYACCVTLCHELSWIIHEFNIKHLTLNI